MTKRDLLVVLATLSPVSLGAQSDAKLPVFGLYAGIGQHHGGVGGGAEAYLVPGQLSLWVGAGWPGTGMVATAAAVRWYPAHAPPHRMFFDVSWSLNGVESVPENRSHNSRDYAPGVMMGYSYLAGSGFSVVAGVGMAGPTPEGVMPMLQVAAGWTWRR